MWECVNTRPFLFLFYGGGRGQGGWTSWLLPSCCLPACGWAGLAGSPRMLPSCRWAGRAGEEAGDWCSLLPEARPWPLWSGRARVLLQQSQRLLALFVVRAASASGGMGSATGLAARCSDWQASGGHQAGSGSRQSRDWSGAQQAASSRRGSTRSAEGQQWSAALDGPDTGREHWCPGREKCCACKGWQSGHGKPGST